MEFKKGEIGFKSMVLIFVIFAVFVFVIVSGIFNFGATLMDQSFSGINLSIGNQSFNDTYQETLGQGLHPIINNGDLYGVLLLFGMILVMLIFAYYSPTANRLWFLSEFFVLIVAFIFAVSIQKAYVIAINASSTLLDIYSINLIKSSKFVMNLTKIIPAVWAFIVLLSYGKIKKDKPIASSEFGDLGY